MDKKYWENYYKSRPSAEASPFAQYVFENHLKEGGSLIELGCGNGRDSVFFAQNNIQVVAVDQCEEEINDLRDKHNLPNLDFLSADFTKLVDMNQFDYVYSRFTLHSISESDEDAVIKWAKEHIKLNGKFLIEARGKLNEIYKLGEPVPGDPDAYIYEGHYRRFVDIDTLQRKLTSAGFQVILKEEKSGFAPFKDTDYVFIRMIAQKN